MVFKSAVKAIPSAKGIAKGLSSFVVDSGSDAGKFLTPVFIGGKLFGTLGAAAGAVGGAAWMKNKAAAGTLLVLTAIDLIETLAFGGQQISNV